MSFKVPLEELKEQHKRILEDLKQLEKEKKAVEREMSSIIQEEKDLIERLRTCRDPYEYSKIDMRLNTISSSRREIEARKAEIERKIRGYRGELESVERRIEYLKPRSSQP